MNPPATEPVTLIGHPFARVGMAEQLRSHMAACRAVQIPFQTLDIFRYATRSDADHLELIGDTEIAVPGRGIRIFHINADEVDNVREAFEARGGRLADGYNIIVPAWELPRFPAAWVDRLRGFDEVWALSRYIAAALDRAGIQSTWVGQSAEVPLGYFLPRRYFGLRESAFTLLHFFDLTSYATRKNPDAVLRVYEALRRRERFRDVQLVLKVKRAEEQADDWLEPIRARVPDAVCLSRPLSALETRSLVNAADCFVSLHRAEGFGRGTAEAMFLGRLALATGYSGNTDHMTRDNALLVDYRLRRVGRGEYPHGQGQRWAEPDTDHAIALLERALAEPDWARELARRGQRDVRRDFSHRAVGLRILERLEQIRWPSRRAVRARRRRRAGAGPRT